MTTAWVDIESGGWKPDTLAVMYGRGTGKSHFMSLYQNLWSEPAPKPVQIEHGTMVHKNKYKYWAKVKGGRFGLEREITGWCEETFGALETPGYKNPRWTNKISWGVWHFKHEHDLTLFLLRWT